MPTIVAVLQARSTSRRLPQKVLRPVLGKAMILRQLERISRARLLTHVVVATSTEASDDGLAQLLQEKNFRCHRGSLEHVLDRFLQAARSLGVRPDHVVRLTADCPLTDPEIIDEVIRAHLESGADYTSNTLKPTFPDGLDAEVMTWETLLANHAEAQTAFQREHVTPYVYQTPGRFRLHSHLRAGTDLSALRWTVDEAKDLEFIEKVYAELYPAKPNFTSQDILDLLKRRPELAALNHHITRNDGAKA